LTGLAQIDRRDDERVVAIAGSELFQLPPRRGMTVS
jgi:hypothetical protein